MAIFFTKIGAPQCMQNGASLETRFPQSGHLIRAIVFTPFRKLLVRTFLYYITFRCLSHVFYLGST